MAFAAARMILKEKDKRRKPSKEEYIPRTRSKARSGSASSYRSLSQARNKPADGNAHVTQPRPRTPTHGAKGGPKTPCKSSQKQLNVQQKGQPIRQAPAKVDAGLKKTKKTKKGKHHQPDLIVTIDLVRILLMLRPKTS
ncbi:uncharacterized protein LOC125503411 isoform X1 [Dendroctonus ponderosae]|uniref:uncharacterized protein LOC125503411 isoform X1 n=1 Tax=Dendroctonus ponderosae TaxID=77166 RepID=UPI002035762B|nr:uncharacterized protein LOC125503411 isoform X1 [Dendroctonus ponderosae]